MTSTARRLIPTDPTLRVLAALSLADRIGSGALMSILAIYFTRSVGFSAHDVAFAFSCAAAAAILLAVPLGHLSDRIGPPIVMRVAASCAALVVLVMPWAHSPWQLALLVTVQGVFDRASGGARNAIIPRVAQGAEAVGFRAYLRAVTNTAIALGALVGGVALWFDTKEAYLVAFVLDALSYVVVAYLSTRLPELPPVPHAEPRRLAVFRDVPYVLVNSLIAIQCMHFIVIELAIPLSLVNVFHAPTWFASASLLINTIMVATLQVRMSRGSDSVLASRATMRYGTLLIAAGFALMGFAAGLPVWGLVAVAVLGSVVHTFGEMISSGGQWGIQMGLAPMERQGQYQAFNSMAFSVAALFAPPLVAFLCVDHGQVGWYVIAASMAVVAFAIGPVSGWALRNRERYSVTTHTG